MGAVLALLAPYLAQIAEAFGAVVALFVARESGVEAQQAADTAVVVRVTEAEAKAAADAPADRKAIQDRLKGGTI
jgi:hypothetical protein